MVATGGFGALPNNPLTETFQNVIEENVPSEFLEPLNTYMDEISSPRISSDPDPDFQPSPYLQVFGHKYPFQPNLSILDLLFCTGPQALFVLKECIHFSR